MGSACFLELNNLLDLGKLGYMMVAGMSNCALLEI